MRNQTVALALSSGRISGGTLLFYSQAARGPELDLSKSDYYLRAFEKRTGVTLWERQRISLRTARP